MRYRRPRKSAEYVKEWRRRFRQRVTDAFGGKCGICSYNRCLRALELHHLDPTKKELSFGRILARACNWDRVVAELRKCTLLCANCHREFHDGLITLSDDIQRFNENYADYRAPEMEPCSICGKSKRLGVPTCSRACAIKKSEKINWPDNLPDLVAATSKLAVARGLGVSDKAVLKRLRNHHSFN